MRRYLLGQLGQHVAPVAQYLLLTLPACIGTVGTLPCAEEIYSDNPTIHPNYYPISVMAPTLPPQEKSTSTPWPYDRELQDKYAVSVAAIRASCISASLDGCIGYLCWSGIGAITAVLSSAVSSDSRTEPNL
ncbi:hypothetical protein F4806DRAFT_71908 [Annulohypoxylon nitens]|nr:hypothetical protein F4806DRAFT_71908 [Annulohypoxylon nitens]